MSAATAKTHQRRPVGVRGTHRQDNAACIVGATCAGRSCQCSYGDTRDNGERSDSLAGSCAGAENRRFVPFLLCRWLLRKLKTLAWSWRANPFVQLRKVL